MIGATLLWRSASCVEFCDTVKRRQSQTSERREHVRYLIMNRCYGPAIFFSRPQPHAFERVHYGRGCELWAEKIGKVK